MGMAITVRNGTQEDYEDIQSLCDARFGAGYIDRAEYGRWLAHPGLLKVALADGAFAGFAVMLPADVREIMRRMDMPEADVREIAGGRPALIYKSAAVKAEHERRGVMKALAGAGLRDARALGYGALFGSAWVYGGRMPIEGTFRAFGFQRLYERHMLWHSDENYRCVVCKGRCTCDAVIYYKKL